MKKTDPKVDTEKALLGCLLYDCNPAIYACMQNGITEESFLEPKNKKVWNAIQQVIRRGGLADVMTVDKALEGDWDAVLNEMVDKFSTIAHVDYYAEQVRAQEKQRQFVLSLNRAITQVTRGADFAQVLETTQQEIMGLSVDNSIKVTKIKDYKAAKVEQWDSAQGVGYVGIPFVLPQVNDALGGMRKQMVSVIGAYRGLGKSTLARQCAFWQVQQGFKAALFTPEDSGEVASAGIVGNKANLSVFRLDTGNSTKDDIDRMAEVYDEIGDIPLFIIPNHLKIGQIAATATMIKARYGLDIIYIDHIQLIHPIQLGNMNRTNTMSVYSAQLCALAKQLDIHICELSQLSRESEKKDRAPKLSDLRDSGSIEQDARQVLLLSYDKDTKLHTIEVAKNNNGVSNVDILVKRVDGRQRFEEVDENE